MTEPIFLTINASGQEFLIDQEDYEKFKHFKLYATLDRPLEKNGKYYIRVDDFERLHRLIMGCSPNDGVIIDHINKNTLDNRRSNLRRTTHQGNLMNKNIYSNSKSGIAGVQLTAPKNNKSPYWYAEMKNEKTKTFSTSVYGDSAKGFAIHQRHLWNIKHGYTANLETHPERIIFTPESLNTARKDYDINHTNNIRSNNKSGYIGMCAGKNKQNIQSSWIVKTKLLPKKCFTFCKFETPELAKIAAIKYLQG